MSTARRTVAEARLIAEGARERLRDRLRRLLRMFVDRLGALLLGAAIAACIALVGAFPVKWCWNHTMPAIFHLKEIGYGEAWCLTFLAAGLRACLSKTP
jgi:hypothetical protein